MQRCAAHSRREQASIVACAGNVPHLHPEIVPGLVRETRMAPRHAAKSKDAKDSQRNEKKNREMIVCQQAHILRMQFAVGPSDSGVRLRPRPERGLT